MKVKVIKKGAFRKKNITFKTIKLFISSVYHFVHEKNQISYNTFLSTIYSSGPKSYFLASGQDMNTNIGCNVINDEFSCIGKHNFKIGIQRGLKQFICLICIIYLLHQRFVNIHTILLGGALMAKIIHIIQTNRLIIH